MTESASAETMHMKYKIVFLGDQSVGRGHSLEHFSRPASGTGRSRSEERARRTEAPMTIVIAAGGTGGHLYPAVALAREFLRRDPAASIVFVGTTKGIESKVLAHEGFPLEFITAKPVMGKGLDRKSTRLNSSHSSVSRMPSSA